MLLLVFLLCGQANLWARSDAVIQGNTAMDTSVWASTAYLSLIPEMSQLNTISLDHIISQTIIDKQGNFNFKIDLLGDRDQLYRIHFVKKGDPPASLIIGGREHNHFFLLLGSDAKVMVRIPSGKSLLEGLTFEGYSPNLSLLQASRLVHELNSIDEQASVVDRNYSREIINRQLREMADTSSHILISIYALWHSDYREHLAEEPGWYKLYLKKWREDDSAYLKELHQEFGIDKKDNGLVVLLLILLVLLVLLVLMIKADKSNTETDLSDLTVQERKVYALLREGYSNKEIAGDLAVSVSTVKTHVNNIFTKLGITSRKEIMDHTGSY